MAEYSAERESLLMALASKAGAKKKAAAVSRAASFNPDDMFQGGGGLPDLFRGTIRSARIFKWAAKEGSTFGDRLAVRLLIEPTGDQPDDAILPEKHLDEHDGHVEARYGLGKITDWLPSEDGENPVDVDADEEGIYAVPTESLIEKFERTGNEGTPQLNRGTNWAFFLQKLIDVGYDKKQLLPNVDSLEGTEAIFCRVPPPDRGGIPASATGDAGERRSDNRILVATELIEVPYKAAKGKAAAAGKTAAKASAGKPASKAAAKAASNGAGELDAKMYAAIEEALGEADDGTLTLNAAKKVAVKALDSDEKKDGLARLGDEEFWADWENGSLDDETGEVSLIG